ncbi:hypothetical protein [Roseovarius indicus]|uniref:Uncharacterized protein n=1 Tax=Roseovarius indicus TaxID=540747 RepID=A0A0T5P3J0_9RHOB|nr:hypothetical protein [Roseovarius indicus]KRS15638.1 hypothetical protein XM52_22620 [Roseovarius indicus]QEW27854.1 hypothetical protein RIdsm_03675 [Roseovarius indicus]SFE79214.1 hypothetical protein SAMN04488031_12212 [Roseovarius indicus]
MSDGQDITLRTMTADELRGFNYALDCMETWARQLEAGAADIPETGPTVPLGVQIVNSARMTRDLTRAMRAGFGPPPPPRI